MKSNYANAKDILPPDLLAEVQKHYCGFLWIPSSPLFFEDRCRLVFALKEQGIPTREIARLAGITRRRVNQIVSKKNEINLDTFQISRVCNK